VIAGDDEGTVEVARRLFPVPDDLARVVFCLGVAPAADFPPSGDPDDCRFAPHSADNVDRQSRLCSAPFDLPTG
jgi:hypothetical protein